MTITPEEYADYKLRKRAKKEATYDERRAHALSVGTKVNFLVCPLCGMNRAMKRAISGPPEFIKAKLETLFIQVRYGGGGGIGFFTNEDESVPLAQAKELFPEEYAALKAAVQHLAELLE